MTLPQYPFKLLSETCAAVDLALKRASAGNVGRKRSRSRSALTEIGAPLETLFNKEISTLQKKFSFLRHHIEGNTQTHLDEYLRTKSLQGKFGSALGNGHSLKKKKKKLSNDATKILQTWLLEHTDDPYPSAAEKKRLQKLTNLTNVQIRNWFTNVRKRHLNPIKNGREPRCNLDYRIKQREDRKCGVTV